jgi:Glycosyl transferase family 2
MGGSPRVCVVSASRQNVYFSEILEALAGMLAEAGVEIERSVDCFPPLEDDLVYMFVPHEFHALVEELAHPNTAQLRRSVAICTEQPGTHWFELSAALAAKAGAVLDINRLGVTHMRARGIAAEHLPLGYVPAWDAWGGDEESERELDVVFLGGYAERRGRVLARCAPYLEDRRTELTLTETGLPHTGESKTYWARERKWKRLAEAKLLLNVHRSDVPYLEWHRVLGAQLNGCVVVTEHCVEIEPLVPGEHYVSASYWQLPEVLGGLLEDPDRIARIRRDAYSFLREEMPVARTMDRLTRAAERAGRRPVTVAAPAGSVPLPAPPEPPKPPWEGYAEHAGESLATRMGLKHLIVRMRNLEHHLEELARRDGDAPASVVEFGPELESPKVSVILTVHNYADFVGDAIRSVALSSLREVEVIALDDASTDPSVEAVEAACRELPWLSLTHVRLPRNRGLPAARNLAAEYAKADLLFILDADNEVLPQGLFRLSRALEENPEAAFAYGIIEAFDVNGPTDLMNYLPWNPDRLRQGNYIDAMAMLRRSALAAVGGYSTDPALYGWEDFALWLELASRDHEGVHVPDFVGRYRKSPHSMIALANVDSTAAWGALLRRYPQLARDASGMR